MNYSYTAKKRIRKNFGKLGDVLPIPNLIELQLLSYNKFLGKNTSKKTQSIHEAKLNPTNEQA